MNHITNESIIGTFEILDAPPLISDEVPADQSFDISLEPTLSINITDQSNDDVEWSIFTNESGSWMLLSNGILSGGNGMISTTGDPFDDYERTYCWSINISDGDDWVNHTYQFTTIQINTTIDMLPSTIYNAPFQINATSNGPLDNVTLWYRYREELPQRVTIFNTSFEQTAELANWTLDPTQTTAGSEYELVLSDEGSIGPRTGAYYLGGTGSFGPDITAYNRTINISEFGNVNVSLWTSYKETEQSDYFGVYWLNGTTWEIIYENLAPQESDQSPWIQTEVSIPDSIDDLTIQFRWSTSNNDEIMMIDDLNITGIKKEPISWINWLNISNPDTSTPWSWSFDFQNQTGYYDFQSIGRKSGSSDEELLENADTNCYYQD